MQRQLAVIGLYSLVYVLLTVALTWPLVLAPGFLVPNDLGDSLLNVFLLAWNARELPLTERWWNLPQFYPIAGTMAFSEHLLGLSLIATPVIWATGNPLLGYNLAFFLSFPLCALAAHLLAYELTRRHVVALVAGVAYGFAPYRMSQFAHVQVLSAYWMPLALLGLHLFLRTRQSRWLALAAGSWLLQALACGNYLFYFSVLIGLWLLWFGVGRLGWRDLARITGAWTIAAIALAPVALGYLRYQRAYGFRRWPDEIESFSADLASVATASGNLLLWGWLQAIPRPESALFPGLALLVTIGAGIVLAWSATARGALRRLRTPRMLFALAAVFAFVAATPLLFGPWRLEPFGARILSVSTPQKPFSVALLLVVLALALHPSIRTGWARRSPLAFYTLAAIAMWAFSLGPSPTLMGEPLLYKAPYAWLMLLPGVDGVRVPARFWALATLCLAVAGALATVHLLRRWPRLGPALPLALAGVILAEAWPQPLTLLPPPAARPAAGGAATRLELPIGPAHDVVALYRASLHRLPVFNGYSGYFAPHYGPLQEVLFAHDPRALDHLTSFGAMEVVVDDEKDGAGTWRRFVEAYPGVETVTRGEGYTLYRLPAGGGKVPAPPPFAEPPLPIASIGASLHEGRLGQMIDNDIITRWDTGGPQGPTDEVIIDLGAERRLEGLEMQIAGFVADFPRELILEISPDRTSWTTAWSGPTAVVALTAALHEPRTLPLRFPIGASARYVRLRQTSWHPVYYWSIAELRVHGR